MEIFQAGDLRSTPVEYQGLSGLLVGEKERNRTIDRTCVLFCKSCLGKERAIALPYRDKDCNAIASAIFKICSSKMTFRPNRLAFNESPSEINMLNIKHDLTQTIIDL